MLEGANPGRTYSTSLLSRTLRRGKVLHFGADPHCMTSFMEECFAIRENGGFFKFSMNTGHQLTTVFIQVLDGIYSITF